MATTTTSAPTQPTSTQLIQKLADKDKEIETLKTAVNNNVVTSPAAKLAYVDFYIVPNIFLALVICELIFAQLEWAFVRYVLPRISRTAVFFKVGRLFDVYDQLSRRPGDTFTKRVTVTMLLFIASTMFIWLYALPGTPDYAMKTMMKVAGDAALGGIVLGLMFGFILAPFYIAFTNRSITELLIQVTYLGILFMIVSLSAIVSRLMILKNVQLGQQEADKFK